MHQALLRKDADALARIADSLKANLALFDATAGLEEIQHIEAELKHGIYRTIDSRLHALEKHLDGLQDSLAAMRDSLQA